MKLKKLLGILVLSAMPFVINAQTVVYDIIAGNINGLTSDCGSTSSIYNACVSTGTWGFTWASTGSGTPTSITLEFYRGIDCGANGGQAFDLNGTYQNNMTVRAGDCICDPAAPGLDVFTLNNASYVAGGTNAINVVNNGDCMGLHPNSAWGGAYARVTVVYSGSSACSSALSCGTTISTFPYNEDFEGEIQGAVGCGATYTMQTTGWNNLTNGATGTTETAGPTTNGIGGGANYTNLPDGLVFDVNTACTLDGVYVYPNGAGNVTVNLRNSGGTLLNTATVAVSTTTKTYIPLGFALSTGTNFELDATGTTTGGLYRNSGGAVYPYTSTGGAVSITETINGLGTSGYYYFFYDWQLSVGACGDDIDWISNVGATGSVTTGPTTDFNPGTASGHYLYTEASCSGIGFPSMEAILQGPCFNLASLTSSEIEFAYNMYGSTMGTMYLEVNSGSSWVPVWSLSGDQGTAWQIATVDISAYDGMTIGIRFRGITGSNYYSDMAIDDINVRSSTCTLTAPTASGASNCGPASLTLTGTPASGGTTCYWYTTSTGGSPFFTGTSYTTTFSTTTTYYVSTYDGSCESTSRTPVTATIYTIPTVSITNLNSSYCTNDGAVTMTGSPSGGTFSGTGVSGSIFTPSTAGTGTHTITYAYTDGNGCSNTTTQTVSVNAPPTVTSSGLGANYCTSDSPVTLTGVPSGGTFSGPGISGSTFNPSTAGTGSITITYSYTDGNGCTSSSTQTTNISVPPSVSFSGLGSSYCVSASSVSLTGSPSGGTFSGNGISGSSFNPANAGTGTHSISYTYTDGNGCSNTSTQNVTINALPSLSISNLNGAYCVGSGTTTMVGSPSGGTFSGTGVSGNVFDPSTAGLGSHVVTYTYTDGNSCTNSITQTVDVVSSPTASITMNSTYCNNDTAFVVNVSPVGGTLSGNGVSGGMFNPTVAGTGTHTLIYNFNAGAGCSDADTITVTVNAAPTGVSFTGLPASACSQDASVTLSGSPSGGTFSGTGVSGSTFDPTLAGAGTFVIGYTVTSGGCSTTSTQTVSVSPAPTTSFTGLSVSGYCVTDADVTLTGSPAGGTFSGTGVSGSTFSPSTAGAGTYSITYSYTDGSGCTGTSTQQVAVTTAGTPTASFTSTVNTFTATFTDQSTNASSWSWDFGDGVGTSTNQNPGSYTYASAGTYTVCLSVLNACGGSDITCVNVTITTGGGTNSINSDVNDMFTLFPNPTTGELNLNMTVAGKHQASVDIVDMLGRSVITYGNESFTDNMNVKIDISDHDSGVYFVRLMIDNDIIIKKVVLER